MSGNPVEINREIVYNEKEFPLHFAVIKGMTARVRELLEGGSNVHERDRVCLHVISAEKEKERRRETERDGERTRARARQ